LPNPEPPIYQFGDSVQAVARVTLPLVNNASVTADDHKIWRAILDLVERGKIIDGQSYPYIRIANAIVDLVERTDGPVTFTQIEREVEGFATNEPSSWAYALGERPGQPAVVVWNGMSEAGAAALCQVMLGRRVAVQIVTPDLYLDRFL